MNTALVRILAALAIFSCAVTARSAPLSPDPTGLWFDPAQPGWGLEVAQQGETVFAVLFTYDAGHTPQWYVASNLAPPPPPDFNEIPLGFRGALYRTTGPAFSSPFDPNAVTATAVGELQIYYVGTSPRKLALDYWIDGVKYSKTLQAQSWSASAQDLLGSYAGGVFVTLAPGSSRFCPDASQVTLPPVQPFQPYGFSISAGSAPDRVEVLWGSGIDLGCEIGASYSRDGQLAQLSGGMICGPIGFPTDVPGNPVASGSIATNGMGFFGTAHLQTMTLAGDACNYDGTFGGVVGKAQSRPGMGPDPTGVWFNPEESGWGLILTQQGANIFAALFAYGADGKPAWWVASNVVDTGQHANTLVGEIFSGTLYRTTGPYFGNQADTTVLSATSAGSLQVAYIGGTDKIALTYTIDGTTIQKTVQRETWSSNQALLSGTYIGGFFPSASACGTEGLFASQPATFTVTPETSSPALRLKWPTGPGTGCVLDAAYVQTGQLASLAGPVHCGAIDNPQAAPGTITISSVIVTSAGFAGFANFTGDGCTTGGFIGGVRH